MSSRLAEIRDDFEKIGIVHSPKTSEYAGLPTALNRMSFSDLVRDEIPTIDDPSGWTLNDMFHLLWKSYAILEPNFRPQLNLGDQITSNAARDLVEYAKAINHEPFQRSGVDDCTESEPKLLKHLGIDYRETSVDFPLLIAEDKGHPVGVIKGVGTILMYGLENRPWYGVLRAGFSTPMSYSVRMQMFRSRSTFLEKTALRYPKNEERRVFRVPISDLGLMWPTRLTQFSVDTQDRQQLKSGGEKAYMSHTYSVSHEAIIERVVDLFKSAVPLAEARAGDVYDDFMRDLRGQVFER